MRTRTTPIRRILFTGMIVFLAGCTATGGGCSPTGGAAPATTTTIPGGGSTTTTTPSSTSTTAAPTTTAAPSSTTTTTVPDPGSGLTLVADVEVEDCLTLATDDVVVAEVELTDCDEPHQAEVYAQFELDRSVLPGDGDDYPGANELTWYADDECRDRFEDYTGHSYWTSPYDLRSMSPSFSTWDTGDRLVTCLIVNADGSPLTTSARAT